MEAHFRFFFFFFLIRCCIRKALAQFPNPRGSPLDDECALLWNHQPFLVFPVRRLACLLGCRGVRGVGVFAPLLASSLLKLCALRAPYFPSSPPPLWPPAMYTAVASSSFVQSPLPPFMLVLYILYYFPSATPPVFPTSTQLFFLTFSSLAGPYPFSPQCVFFSQPRRTHQRFD